MVYDTIEEKKISNDNLTFKTASLWGAQYESKTLKNDHDIVIIDTPPKIESDARPSIEVCRLGFNSYGCFSC